MISYCAVYNLVKICHELKWDTNRDGLRIAIWNALYKHKSMENDTRVFDAEKIAEVCVEKAIKSAFTKLLRVTAFREFNDVYHKNNILK